MNATIIDSWSGFAALEKEWNELLESSRANTIFLTWEWLQTWADVVGASVQPFVITVRDADSRLIGAVPYYVAALRALGVVTYRTLRVMADEATGAEYPDWILRADCEEEAATAIAGVLARTRAQWDCIWMPRMAGWTGARERIVTACGREGFYAHSRPGDFAVVSLPPSMETYTRELSANNRQRLKANSSKVLGRSGISITRCTSETQLSRMLDALFDLHRRRWNERGEEGGFVHRPSLVRFYRQFAPVALKKGWLSFFGLEENGQLKAVQIGYVYDKVFHSMQEGFDPDYVKGAGNVLRARAIEACIAEGVHTYDFLGGMSDHKRSWRAKERTGQDLLLGHPNLKNRVLFAREIWPTGRYLRPVNPR